MFGGRKPPPFHTVQRLTSNVSPTAPPQPTAEELQEQETLANTTIYGALGMCIAMYFCT